MDKRICDTAQNPTQSSRKQIQGVVPSLETRNSEPKKLLEKLNFLKAIFTVVFCTITLYNRYIEFNWQKYILFPTISDKCK